MTSAPGECAGLWGMHAGASHDAEEIGKLLAAEFPQAFYPGCGLSIERVGYGRYPRAPGLPRGAPAPGGTISGPTMMELADFAMYVAVFSAIGPQPLAVTTQPHHQFPAQAGSRRPHRRGEN